MPSTVKKRPMLASELKKGQKRTTVVPPLPSGLALVKSQTLSQPSQQPKVQPIIIKECPATSLSMRMSVKPADMKVISECQLVEQESPLIWFRFPPIPVSTAHLKRISNLLRQPDRVASGSRELRSAMTEAAEREERIFYRQLLSQWRPALQSAYGAFRKGLISYFQVKFTGDLAFDFIATNETRTVGVEGASIAFRKAMEEEGIAFEQSGVITQVENESHSASETSSPLSAGKSKEQIKRRQRRAQLNQESPSSTATIKGDLDLNALIDWMLNQPDGHSLMLLPVIMAPKPFLHAALMRTQVTIHGPIQSHYQLKTDFIMPAAVKHLIAESQQTDPHCQIHVDYQ